VEKITMTPLPQQLEDKKKGCGEMFQPFLSSDEFYNDEEIFWKCGDLWNEKPLLCPSCKAEIAILEQAIAEIKELQSQQTKPLEFVETDRGCKPISLTGITRCNSSKDKTADTSNLLQKQRQEIEKVFERVLNRIIGKIEDSRNNGEMIIDYCKKIKEQLNQPKTDENNNTIQNPND
jgi:hypothetical protein